MPRSDYASTPARGIRPDHRLVDIEAIDPETRVALIHDSFGARATVPLRFERSRDPVPGEMWIADYSMGFPTLLCPVNSPVTSARKIAVTVAASGGSPVVITHNMATLDVIVQAYNESSGNWVEPTSSHSHPETTGTGPVGISNINRDLMTVSVTFESSGTYRVVVMG